MAVTAADGGWLIGNGGNSRAGGSGANGGVAADGAGANGGTGGRRAGPAGLAGCCSHPAVTAGPVARAGPEAPRTITA